MQMFSDSFRKHVGNENDTPSGKTYQKVRTGENSCVLSPKSFPGLVAVETSHFGGWYLTLSKYDISPVGGMIQFVLRPVGSFELLCFQDTCPQVNSEDHILLLLHASWTSAHWWFHKSSVCATLCPMNLSRSQSCLPCPNNPLMAQQHPNMTASEHVQIASQHVRMAYWQLLEHVRKLLGHARRLLVHVLRLLRHLKRLLLLCPHTSSNKRLYHMSFSRSQSCLESHSHKHSSAHTQLTP